MIKIKLFVEYFFEKYKIIQYFLIFSNKHIIYKSYKLKQIYNLLSTNMKITKHITNFQCKYEI